MERERLHPLPAIVFNINGLSMPVLGGIRRAPIEPLVLILHVCSKEKNRTKIPLCVMLAQIMCMPLAAAAMYVIAPDQRGTARTSGWEIP